LTFAQCVIFEKYPEARFRMNSVYRLGFGKGLMLAALWWQFMLHTDMSKSSIKTHFVVSGLLTVVLTGVSYLKFKQYMEK